MLPVFLRAAIKFFQNGPADWNFLGMRDEIIPEFADEEKLLGGGELLNVGMLFQDHELILT
jgi:hypothetical protein